MTEPQATVSTLQYLNSIGTAGLALVVVVLYRIIAVLMKGDLITRREFDALVIREQGLEKRLDRALHINDRAMEASDKLVERIPAKEREGM